jgi:AraC-like DNA-binding protein
MPSSAVRAFSDPHEYAAAIRQGTHQLIVTQSGSFAAKLSRIDFHRLWMQRFSENLARNSHVDGWGGRAVIAFRTEPGPSLVRNGTELSPSSISWLRPGQSYFQRSAGRSAYSTMSLPLEELTVFSRAIIGRELLVPSDARTVVPAPGMMARLQRLHAAAATLAEDAPEVLCHPDASRGLEQALIEAMVECLGSEDMEEDRAASRQHAAIMRRFHQVIDQHLDQPLYTLELCGEIAVSERTLRTCCQEYLGMSPKHYLLLRRMHLVRRALRESTPTSTTVTEIATRYGFWQFGRLAVEYKALFGESPSATLSRRRD